MWYYYADRYKKEVKKLVENNKLLEMTLSEILSLNQDYKMKVIQLLINQIAEDEVYNAVSHFETEKEQEEYITKEWKNEWKLFKYCHIFCNAKFR